MYILEVSYGCPSEKYPSNGNFQLDQAKALFGCGNKVVFAALDMRSFRRWRRWGLSCRTQDGIPVYEYNFPMGPFAGTLRRRLAAHGFEKLLARVIREHGRPNIVHVHFADTAAAVVEACRRRSIPFAVTEHASSLMDDATAAPQKTLMDHVYKNAACVIAVSPALAAQIKKYTGVEAVVVDDIVDTDTFRFEPAARMDGAPFRFVSAGHAERRKGFDALAEAFARVCAVRDDCELAIMGDGAELENIKRQIAALGLTDKVCCTGCFRRSEFARKLNESDCFVLASRHETFGVVYAEAMCCGVPVIATRCGGTEGFIGAEDGLMVDVDDVGGLAEAMLDVCGNVQRYDKAAIARRARERFSPDAVGARIAQMLENTLRRS